jgi:hypothetical protein
LNTVSDANRMIYDAQETDLDLLKGISQLALSHKASMLQWTTSHLTAYGAILASRWREFCVKVRAGLVIS